MQRLLKFATSPNTNRRTGGAEQGGIGSEKSADSTDGSVSPPREIGNKLKILSLSPQEQTISKLEQEGIRISSEPSSPHPSANSSGYASLTSPPAPTSPPATQTTSPPATSNTGSNTPARSRRMAFFNSNRFSLDEYSHSQRSSSRTALTGDHSSPTTPPSSSPQNTPPTHHRRAAVHLAASPIRLLSPKSGGGIGCIVGNTGSNVNAQMTNFCDLEYMNTSKEGHRLTLEQRELVRLAWRSCNAEFGQGGGGTAGVWIFKRIFAHHPHLKRLFNLHELEDERLLDADPQFQKHAQVFSDVLEMIVECIDALDDSLGPLLLSYGSKHVQFEAGHGFRPEYWDAFAVAMTEYATNNWKFMKNSHRRTEALRAWRILVFFVVSKVKQGFILEKQALEKRRIDSCDGDTRA